MSQEIQKRFLEIIIFSAVFCFIALTNHTVLVVDDTSPLHPHERDLQSGECLCGAAASVCGPATDAVLNSSPVEQPSFALLNPTSLWEDHGDESEILTFG